MDGRSPWPRPGLHRQRRRRRGQPPSRLPPRTAARGTPPPEPRRTPTKPDAAQPAIVPGSVGHMIPTPGIGEPDGRKGIQDQVTPIGRGSRGVPQQLAAAAVRGRSACSSWCCCCYAMVRFRRGANPTPSRNSHNTADRGGLDAGPGADPGRDRDPLDPPAAPPIYAAAGRRDGQGHRPPMVLDATNIPTMASSFDSYMLKEANDPTRQANQRARTDADGPPLLAVDERMVIPAGKVVKFIVTADDVIHSFAVPGLLDQAGRQPRPAQRDLGQGRPAGRLFRPMLGAVRRPPRLHADRGRGAFRRRSSPQWVASKGGHHAGRQARPRRPPRASPRPTPPRPPRQPRRRRPQPQPATNQAATAQN